MSTSDKMQAVVGIAVNPSVEPVYSGLRDSKNRLKLGLFSINLSGGLNLSAIPRKEEFGWEWTSRIALTAD